MNKFKVGDVVKVISMDNKVGTVVKVFDYETDGIFPYLVSFNLDRFTFNGYYAEHGTFREHKYATPEYSSEFHEFCEACEIVMVEPFGDTKEDDDVNHPSHYTQGSIETIKLIEELLGKRGFIDYCMGNVVKYTQRHKHKGTPLKDLKKAQFYLNALIEKMEENENE